MPAERPRDANDMPRLAGRLDATRLPDAAPTATVSDSSWHVVKPKSAPFVAVPLAPERSPFRRPITSRWRCPQRTTLPDVELVATYCEKLSVTPVSVHSPLLIAQMPSLQELDIAFDSASSAAPWTCF